MVPNLFWETKLVVVALFSFVNLKKRQWFPTVSLNQRGGNCTFLPVVYNVHIFVPPPPQGGRQQVQPVGVSPGGSVGSLLLDGDGGSADGDLPVGIQTSTVNLE